MAQNSTKLKPKKRGCKMFNYKYPRGWTHQVSQKSRAKLYLFQNPKVTFLPSHLGGWIDRGGGDMFISPIYYIQLLCFF